MSMNTTTIIGIPLSPSAWKHWSTTNPTNAAPTPNTAQKHLSWARPPNTINVRSFGPPQTRATCISGATFFKHKYLTNPLVMPEDQVIVAPACLTDTLQGIKSPQLHTSTLQALGDLCNVFYEAANATNARLFAADTSPRQVAPLPPCNLPLVLKARDYILSPSQSPHTPPRVQPNLAPDLATILFGREAPLIPSDVPPQQIAPPTPTPISPTKPLHRSQ